MTAGCPIIKTTVSILKMGWSHLGSELCMCTQTSHHGTTRILALGCFFTERVGVGQFYQTWNVRCGFKRTQQTVCRSSPEANFALHFSEADGELNPQLNLQTSSWSWRCSSIYVKLTSNSRTDLIEILVTYNGTSPSRGWVVGGRDGGCSCSWSEFQVLRGGGEGSVFVGSDRCWESKGYG